MTGALYERDGRRYVGTSRTANGWGEGAQAGGAVLALLGHVLEDVPSMEPMLLSRVTADFVRPIPVGQPLAIDAQVVRDGHKVQLVDLVVTTEHATHARARALRVRTADLTSHPDLPASTSEHDPADRVRGRDGLDDMQLPPFSSEFLRHGIEVRRTTEPVGGVHGLWVRLRSPVVEGEPIRSTSRITLPLDCVNLIGVDVFDRLRLTAINPDVSGHVLRAPAGEWVVLVGDTRFAHQLGRGVSSATISDECGVFAVTSTSQLVQPMQ